MSRERLFEGLPSHNELPHAGKFTMWAEHILRLNTELVTYYQYFFILFYHRQNTILTCFPLSAKMLQIQRVVLSVKRPGSSSVVLRPTSRKKLNPRWQLSKFCFSWRRKRYTAVHKCSFSDDAERAYCTRATRMKKKRGALWNSVLLDMRGRTQVCYGGIYQTTMISEGPDVVSSYVNGHSLHLREIESLFPIPIRAIPNVKDREFRLEGGGTK